MFFFYFDVSLSFTTYNRWGENNNKSGTWNGRYRGVLQSMDNYYFEADILLPNEKRITERGDFILVR